MKKSASEKQSRGLLEDCIPHLAENADPGVLCQYVGQLIDRGNSPQPNCEEFLYMLPDPVVAHINVLATCMEVWILTQADASTIVFP